MLRICCAVLVACAQPVQVAPPARPPTAAEIVARTSEVYAKASTYADRGESVARLTTTSRATGKVQVDRLTFATGFRRAGGFRFAYDQDGEPKHAYAISSIDNRDAVAHLRENIADLGPLGIALGIAATGSNGLGDVVPSMLGVHRERPWLAGVAVATVAAEELRGHPCWHLDGTRSTIAVDVWVDRDSYLVRQIRERTHIDASRGSPAFDVDQLTTFEPIANGPITAAQLAPVDTTGLRIVVHERPRWIGVALAPDSMRVMRVFDGTPAANAGIQVGDEIVSVDGHAVANVTEFRAEVARFDIGKAPSFAVKHKDAIASVSIAIAERPDLDEMAASQLVGKPAPAFSLPAIDGTTVALAGLRGKVVVLDFWATWCKPCEIAHPLLVALQAKHPDLALVGISDEEDQVIRDHGASPYPLVRDADGKVARDYIVSGIPHIVLIDKAGIVRFVSGGVESAEQLPAELAKLPP